VFYIVKDAPLISGRFYAMLPARYREAAAVLLSMPHALALGAASGIVEAVPYLGPIAAGTVAALVALPQGAALVTRVVLLFIIIRLFVDLVIGPRLLGHVLRLHPLTVLFAVLVGGHLMGIAGFFRRAARGGDGGASGELGPWARTK
jgi:hypothetical protein